MRNNKLIILLLLAFSTMLTGCKTYFQSDVVSFHEGSLPKGESIKIEASDPAKAQSLEFRAYAHQIGLELSRLGYNYVENPADPATLIAQVDYAIDMGPSDLRVDGGMDPFVRYNFGFGNFRNPYYFGASTSWPQEVSSTPSYMRNLTMNIVKNTEEHERLFEGRVQSRGRLNQLPEVMPYLVTAMFSDFPGESGVTKMVSIETDK